MRRAAKVDANQAEIVKALREVGCSVTLLHQVGGGVPDILVGRDRMTILMEIKDGRNGLTADQRDWWDGWRGAMPVVVRSIDEALGVVGVSTKGKD